MHLLQYFIDKLADHLRQGNKLEEVIKEFQEKYNLLPCIGVEIEFYLSDNINIEKFESLLGMRLKKEKGSNQYEIELPPSTNIVSYIEEIHNVKSKIENIAKKLHGKAYFRAKPFVNDYGNSMHFHVNFVETVSVNNINKCTAWRGAEGDVGIQKILQNSDICIASGKLDGHADLTSARHVHDLLDVNKMAQSICHYMLPTFLIFNAYEDDYLRFDKNFMTPTNVSFGNNNRSVAVRIPDFLPKRIEYRIANPHTNIYIAIFTILNSILLGLEFPDQINNIEKIYGNAFDEQYNLQPLPKSVQEALKLFSLEFFIGARQEDRASIESFLEIMKKLEC